MNFFTVKTIYFKEMMDTLRDKRTLIAMLGVPIILYPLILVVSAQVMIANQSKIADTPSRVAIQADGAAVLREWAETIPLVELVDSEDEEADLAAGLLDAVVRVEGSVEDALAAGGTAEVEIRFDSTEGTSREAALRLEEGFSKEGRKLLTARLEEKGLAESFAEPVAIEREDVAPPSKTVGMALGSVLPLIMVMMLGMGAFYPAIDLTAGEKERGTFETLLSTPTSKLEIVSGKFLTVFSLAMITGILNLASMVATILFQISQIAALAEEEGGQALDMGLLTPDLSVMNVVTMFAILIPLGFFISAVMMTVALYARDFKDAQNLLMPFFIAIILPAAIAALPDMKLTGATQFIPIANISLLFRDLMMGEGSMDAAFGVFLCTSVYALLALLAATWVFQREEVILSEERGIPLTFKRGDFEARDAPTPGLAIGLFAVVMLLIFYVGSYAQAKHLQIGLLITEYLVILAPVVAGLWFVRVHVAKALNLRKTGLGVLLGSVLMTAPCLVFLIEISVWQNKILPIPEEFLELADKLFPTGDAAWSLPAMLFVIALSPALCEEALFRGVLVSGLRPKLPAWATILVVGVLFGLFHLSIYRFTTTGFLGVVLTYLVVRSGSILPAILGHFIINGASVLLQTEHVPEALLRYVSDSGLEENGLPMWVVGLAVLVFVAGVVLVEGSVRLKAGRQPTSFSST